MKALERIARVVQPNTIVPAAWATAAVLHRRRGAARLALGTTLAVAGARVLKHWVSRRRPRIDGETPLQSFPSGHSAASTAYLLGLALLAPRRRRTPALAAAGAGAVAVNALRLLGHEHWPTDVVAGDALGVAGLAAADATTRRVRALRVRARNGRR